MRKILLIVLLGIPFSALADWNGVSDIITNGSGTQNDPYLIESSEQLAYIADMVNSGANDFSGQFIKLATNLSLSNKLWDPIGNKTHPFRGEFDGDGHIIDSLNATYYFSANDALSPSKYKNYIGLFGNVENATIRNFDLSVQAGQRCTDIDNLEVGAGSIVAGAIGYANNTHIFGIKVFGNVVSDMGFHSASSGGSKKYGVAGVVGIARCCMLQYLENYCTVEGTYVVGGVVGRLDTSVVFRCNNHGAVSGSTGELLMHGLIIGHTLNVGGIAGVGTKLSAAIQCANTGNVFGETFYTSYNGKYSSGCYISGIVSSASTIKYCYNTGNLTAGYTGSGEPELRNYAYIRGIGIVKDSMIGCYNVGNLGPAIYNNRWGLTGQSSALVDCSYYLESCFVGGEPQPQYSGQAGASRTEAQMKSSTMVQMLNAHDKVYRQASSGENNGYPVFADGNDDDDPIGISEVTPPIPTIDIDRNEVNIESETWNLMIVHDIMGRRVVSTQGTQAHFSLEKGIYIITVGDYSKKIMITHS